MDDVIVIFHGLCNDGFAAAWVAHKVFPNACYVPVNHGQNPPNVTGKNVYMFDFAYKRPIMLDMYDKAKSIIVLDHHKTAAIELDDLPFCRFDMSKSGATLAWDYFKDKIGGNMPWLISYTEDRDLYKFNLPKSREINAALDSYSLEFNTWNELDNYKEVICSPLVEEGQAIIRFQDRLIDNIVKHARSVELDGYVVRAANTSCVFSQVANKLAENSPFGVAWYKREDSKFVYSLRSDKNGIDVGKLAARLGESLKSGGGHYNSAGFESYDYVLKEV